MRITVNIFQYQNKTKQKKMRRNCKRKLKFQHTHTPHIKINRFDCLFALIHLIYADNIVDNLFFNKNCKHLQENSTNQKSKVKNETSKQPSKQTNKQTKELIIEIMTSRNDAELIKNQVRSNQQNSTK